MKKRFFFKIVSGFLAVLFVATPVASAASFDTLIPSTISFAVDFELQDFLKTHLDTFLQDMQPNIDEENFLIKRVLEGMRFSVGVGNLNAQMPDLYISFPGTEEDFQILLEQIRELRTITIGEKPEPGEETPPPVIITAEIVQKNYDGISYSTFEGDEMSLLWYDGKIYFGPEESIKKIIDVLHGRVNPLSQNLSYTDIKNNLSWDSSFFTLFLDFQDIIAEIIGEASVSSEAGKMEFFNFLKKLILAGGISMSKVNSGYELKGVVKISETGFESEGIEPFPGGLFVPSLYRKFPNLPVLYYEEANNLKKSVEQQEKFREKFVNFLGLSEDAPELNGNPLVADVNSVFQELLGVDVSPLINVLDKQFAFAVQTGGSVLPTFTFIGDVSSNPLAAESFITAWKDAFKLGIGDVPASGVKYSEITVGSKTFHKFSVDLSEASDYEGPEFPELVFIFGITDDNNIVFSTDSRISDHLGQGLQNNAEFMRDFKDPSREVGGIEYIGLRNIWKYLDRLLQFGFEEGSKTGNAPTLSDFEGYLKVVNFLYAGRSVFARTGMNGSSLMTFEVFLNTDSAEHETFDEWKARVKAADSDFDGLSDFDELFVYLTFVDDADTDNDEKTDGQEITDHTDPRNIQSKLSDVLPEAWYAPEVSLLYQRKVINGYDDGTYKASRPVTRAEFVCMVDRAFSADIENFTGVPIDEFALKSGYSPFSDVRSEDWFQTCVSNALKQNFIVYGENFRPGDPINRAEALSILVKTNAALKMAVNQNFGGNMPFTDVPQDAWFNPYVKAGYENGLTDGRTPDSFVPFGTVTRAEAAVMIKRALDFQRQTIENPPENLPEGTPFDLIFPTLLQGFPT